VFVVTDDNVGWVLDSVSHGITLPAENLTNTIGAARNNSRQDILRKDMRTFACGSKQDNSLYERLGVELE
jgi:hypothetical protein